MNTGVLWTEGPGSYSVNIGTEFGNYNPNSGLIVCGVLISSINPCSGHGSGILTTVTEKTPAQNFRINICTPGTQTASAGFCVWTDRKMTEYVASYFDNHWLYGEDRQHFFTYGGGKTCVTGYGCSNSKHWFGFQGGSSPLILIENAPYKRFTFHWSWYVYISSDFLSWKKLTIKMDLPGGYGI
jgi:hypothetical protein